MRPITGTNQSGPSGVLNPPPITEELESLLLQLRTSTKEYVSVIEAFPDREGRNLIRHLVKEREPVAQELRLTILQLGGDPTDPNLGICPVDLQRHWRDIQQRNSGAPEIELLYICEEMDAHLVSELDALLADETVDLPFAYLEILRHHRNILATEVENLCAYRHNL